MPRLSLTKRETKVALDALERLSACTYEELQDWLDWDDEDMAAWAKVTGKLSNVVVGAA
jgi:hypothetical protein